MTLDENIQKRYYSKMAHRYDEMHMHSDDEHYRALKYIEKLSNERAIRSILDIGSGTGRALEYLLNANFKAFGIEPSPELREAGIKRNSLLANYLSDGNGYKIPLNDNSFDAVCEFGVLHHVRYPNRVINEMIRVARKAVFISDSNRFGQGAKQVRWLKYLIWKAGLWPIANFVKTNGKGYIVTEGDGLSYSYSVYDSYKTLSHWATKIIEISISSSDKQSSSKNLILESPHVLLVAIKE